MRRYRLLMISTLLVLVSAGACLAVFPTPDGSMTLPLNAGWFNGTQAWYICTDTNSLALARAQKLTLFYASPTNAAPVYIVTNPPRPQGPVFSAIPASLTPPPPPGPLYSGIWRVIYVKWNSTATKQLLSSELQILNLQSLSKLTLQSTSIAVDYPLIALGSLAAPSYLIPQAISRTAGSVKLPFWKIYCRDPVSRAISVKRVIIPDALSLLPPPIGYIDVALLIGANKAPGLFTDPLSIHNTIVAFNWNQPLPPAQYLVAKECPTGVGTGNFNPNYSPYTDFIALIRLPSVPPGTVFNNFTIVSACPGLVDMGNDAVNAPILPAN